MTSGVTVRRLEEADLFNGFLSSLDSLSRTSRMDPSRARRVFCKIDSNPDHTVLVAVLDGRVVGATTLLLESKFIHDGGIVGHIEDVAVRADMQGRGIGRSLVLAAVQYAGESGCYKTILNCTEKVRPFYERLGFVLQSGAMRFNH